MIPLRAEELFHVAGFPVTDTIAATVLTDLVLLALVFAVYRTISLCPGKLQSVIEIIVDGFYTVTEQIAGSRAKSIFPWFASFFLFIFAANFLGLLPGYGVITLAGHGEHWIPIFRAPSSDLNTTLALAVISVVVTHALSIRYIGVKQYLSKFFSLSPILLFVGLLELVSEFTKLISFSFRLFGNIFAGEVVLGTMSSLMAFFVPIPFLLLEMIVAVVQALVFAMLTMVFMSILTTAHSEGGGH